MIQNKDKKNPELKKLSNGMINNKYPSSFSKKFTLLFIFISTFAIFSTASAIFYSPGATLNPACLPTDVDCDVLLTNSLLATSTIFGGQATGTYDNISIINLSTSSFSSGNISQWVNDIGYLLTSDASSSFLTFDYASSTFPSFTYASSTFALAGSSTQWGTNGTSVYYNAGNVGIGTSSPSQTLDIWGNLNVGTSSNSTLSVNTANRTVSLANDIVSSRSLDLKYTLGTASVKVNSSDDLRLGLSDDSAYIDIDGDTSTHNVQIISGTAGSVSLNSLLYAVKSGNVGIGTTTPVAKLEVYGTAGNNAIANFASSSNSSVLYVGANGNVGIGTSTQNVPLYIQTTASNIATFYSSGATNPTLTIRGSDRSMTIQPASSAAGGVASAGFETWLNGSSATNNAIRLYAGGAAVNYGSLGVNSTADIVLTQSSTTRNILLSGMNAVGIGTTTPASRLDIYGTSSFPTLDLFGVSSSSFSRLFTITSAGKVGIGTSTPATALSVIGTSTTQGLVISNLASALLGVDASGNVIATTTAFVDYSYASSTFPSFTYASSTYALAASGTQWTTSGSNIYYTLGNVGIGSTTPSSPLSILASSTAPLVTINGTSSATDFILVNATGSITNMLNLKFGGVSKVSITPTGFTTFANAVSASADFRAPTFSMNSNNSLTSFGTNAWTAAGTSTNIARITATNSSGALIAALINPTINQPATSSANYSALVIQPTETSISTSTTSYLLRVGTTTSPNMFTVLNNGNVGIGTTTPSQSLEVVGDLFLSGAARNIRYNGSSGALNVWGGTTNVVTFTTGQTTQFGRAVEMDANLNFGSTVGNTNYLLTGTAIASGNRVANDVTVKGGDHNSSASVTDGAGGDVWIYGGVANSNADNSSRGGNLYLYGGTGGGGGGAIGNIILGHNGTSSLGNVGIGTSSPNAKLDIYGTSSFPTLDLFGVSSSSFSRLFTITSAGNVGIGTSTPATALSVIGTSTTQGLVISNLANAFLAVDGSGNVIATTTPAIGSFVTFDYASSTFPSFTYASSTYVSFTYASSTFLSFDYASSTFVDHSYASSTFPSFTYASSTFAIAASGTQWTTNGSDIYYNTGKVGIGISTTPTMPLDVLGGFNVSVNMGDFSATGGTITESGGYKIHTFTSNDDFVPNGTGNIEYLIIAGGGGGGGNVGGGGGGGGFVSGSGSISAGTYSVVVGGGGAGGGGSNAGSNGSDSTFNGNTADGGGGGGGFGAASVAGGSGGGGSGNNASGAAGSQGGDGGSGTNNGNQYSAGGGGGSGGNGTDATATVGGNGGAGYNSSISGGSTNYAGGGGGGAFLTPDATAGTGTDGGGNGCNTGDCTASNGTVNTGGGGGGAGGGGNGAGGAGGSGIVIIRYLTGQGGAVNSAFRVTNTGNVGIGTTTPTSRLDIYGLAGNADIFGVSSSSYERLFTITSDGKVGIGTSTPIANFSASGTIQFISLGSAGANLVTDSEGNVTVSSDERLKNIQGSYERGLADIMKINPIKFKWKTETGYDDSNTYTGFSAQNMSLAIPEAVATGTNGYLTLADRPIVAALVNSIKQIGSFITKIEHGIAYLRNIVVENLAIGSQGNPSGITMYDEVTGNPYCVVITNGILRNENGPCKKVNPSGKVQNDTATVLDTENNSGTPSNIPDQIPTVINNSQSEIIDTNNTSVSTTTIPSESTTTSEQSTSTDTVDLSGGSTSTENTLPYTENVSEVNTPVEQVIVPGAPGNEPNSNANDRANDKAKDKEIKKDKQADIEIASTTQEEATTTPESASSTDLQLGATVFGAEISQKTLLAIVIFVQILMILGFGAYIYKQRKHNQ